VNSTIALELESESEKILRIYRPESRAYFLPKTVQPCGSTSVSAGANCWFEQCSTDSLPDQFTVLSCLGIIRGSFCPHYDGEPERRLSLRQMLSEDKIKSGYAADDGAAAHFIGGEFAYAVSSRPHAKVYKVAKLDEQIVEAAIETQYLAQ
jgi:dipeptidase E